MAGETTIGEFCPFTYGKGLPERDRVASGEVPVYGSNGIVGRHNKALTSGPSVIIGRKGTVGSVHFSVLPCWPIDTTFYIEFENVLKARYAYYLLKTLGLTHMNSDSAVPGLNREAAHARRITIVEEHQRYAIACILGALDDKIELNRRMNQTLEAMARAIFKSWFVDFDPVRAKAAGQQPQGLKPELATLFPDAFEDSELGEIPKGWRVETLGEVCEKPQYGYTASASDKPIGPRFLRITDINKQDWIEWQNVPFCPIEEREFDKYRLEKGDIVIARMADPGHGALVEEDVDVVFASYLIRFRPRQPELGRFLQYWLRSESYWNLVRSRQSGTTRANLNAQVLSSFTLIVPHVRVLEAFSKLIDALRDKLIANVGVSSTLGNLRDTLLPKLISGDLRVPDAERIVERCL